MNGYEDEVGIAFPIRLYLVILNHSLFSILVDESKDISVKEQMFVVLYYVDMQSRMCN